MYAELQLKPNPLERCGLCCFSHQPGIPEGLELPSRPCQLLNLDDLPTCIVFKNPDKFNPVCDKYDCDCKTQLETAVGLILTSPDKFGPVLDHLKTRRLIPETDLEQLLTNPFTNPNDIFGYFEKLLILDRSNFFKILPVFSFEFFLTKNINSSLKTLDKAIAHLEYTNDSLPESLPENSLDLLAISQRHLRWSFLLANYLNQRPDLPFPQNPDRKMAGYLAGTSVLLPQLL